MVVAGARKIGEPSHKPNMEVHHITYERRGNELFGDLIVICRGCHELLHKFISRMVDRGWDRSEVMRRLIPRCQSRLIKIHAAFDDFNNQPREF